MDQYDSDATDDASPGSAECPECGGSQVETRIIVDRFIYGLAGEAVELEATIPVNHCRECQCEFLDHVAEQAKHEAVCRHLGVLSPAEVLALRTRYALSRAAFARITRIGEATLARWERGALIQNPANDMYLALLSFPENLERLRSHSAPDQRRPVAESRGNGRFRALSNIESARKDQDSFSLINLVA